ncbi:unnamed protein product [Candida verbasci]|uniref:t-SNARE coiled-coil homology domain-containing protein n=1 Tax=Candida verbasci TaxID=1227364 RepID=A0A9W4TWU8_9ASCO|nr:unnamed protein product [Candida verbasci]
MSFANIDLEAQKQPLLKSSQASASSSYIENNELDIIINKTLHQLQSFGQLITQFDNQRKQIGSRRDCQQLRNNIDELTDKITDMSKAIQVLILNLSSLINKHSNKKDSAIQVSNRQIVIKERLVSEFDELDKKFKKLIKQYHEKKISTPIPTDHKTEDRKEQQGDNVENQQTQEQLQMDAETINQTELQYQLLLTEERNREIEQVTEGIQEINTIFKDLGQLVNQQGEQLNTIEDNILQLHGNTKQADRELHKANEYQKKKGKWSCILLVALSIFLLIIILIAVS